MIRFFNGIFDCIQKKKAYFIMLLIASIIAIVLGVITAINFGGGVFAIDLDNIGYIKFLKGNCGLMSMIFNLVLSLSVFFIAILLCNSKRFLIPLALVFYLYLIYSQVVVFISIILIYGFLNCVILVVLLFVYNIVIWTAFLLIVLELSCINNGYDYFKKCFKIKECKLLLYLLLVLLAIVVFSVVLTLLKSYVVLLIY